MRRLAIALALAALAAAPGAAAKPTPIRAFEGSCTIAGPVLPKRPINLIPSLHTSFAFHGRGTCSGRLDGLPIRNRKVRFDIPKALILFDTCELGPDLSALATLSIRIRRKKWVEFPLSVDMLRVATIGPFLIRGPHDGQGYGVARLMVPDAGQALADCANPAGGIREAHLEASFQTQTRFIGT